MSFIIIEMLRCQGSPHEFAHIPSTIVLLCVRAYVRVCVCMRMGALGKGHISCS